MGLIVTFAGGRGSGKSTLSAELSRRLGYARVSFGDYVRGEARRHGLTSSGEVLQSIGEELVSAGPTTFARNVLSTTVWDGNGVLLVDGVRHKEILEAIRSIAAPSPVKLVFVNVAKEQRKERLSMRGDDGRQFEKLVGQQPRQTRATCFKGRSGSLAFRTRFASMADDSDNIKGTPIPDDWRGREVVLYCSCPNEITSARVALLLRQTVASSLKTVPKPFRRAR